jgi:hypothetical protein
VEAHQSTWNLRSVSVPGLALSPPRHVLYLTSLNFTVAKQWPLSSLKVGGWWRGQQEPSRNAVSIFTGFAGLLKYDNMEGGGVRKTWCITGS